MPGDMRPGTEWGMMWGFSGDVTLWVRFGGRPGLELKQRAKTRRKTPVSDKRRLAEWGGGGRGGGVNISSTPESNSIPNS